MQVLNEKNNGCYASNYFTLYDRKYHGDHILTKNLKLHLCTFLHIYWNVTAYSSGIRAL